MVHVHVWPIGSTTTESALMFFRAVPRSDGVIAERVYCHWTTCNSKISDERPLAPRAFMLLPIFTFFPVARGSGVFVGNTLSEFVWSTG